MTDKLAIEYIEIDLPYCTRTYGVAPCTAAIGVTGSIKCFNSRGTCQDIANFLAAAATVRFARQTDYLPRDIDCLPYVHSIDYTPAIVSLGENLGQRAELKIILSDHPHSDAGPGFDKYRTERGYDPYKLGTIFGRLRSRYPSLRGVAVRWRMGYAGDTLAAMETRNFFIESFNGPGPDGKFTIIAKDVLKFLDGDRALAPMPSPGFLTADIDDVARGVQLSPSGISADYPSRAFANLGGNEIVEYQKITGVGINANTKLLLHFDGSDGSTTFTDSSGTGKTVASQSAVNIDTDEFVFGGSSALFTGSSPRLQYADSNDWTPAGNFTFDFWMRPSAIVGSVRTILQHFTNTSNFYSIGIATTGSLFFEVISAGAALIQLQTPTDFFEINTWYHIAVVRNGNVFTIYVNGVAQATLTNAAAIPNFAATNNFQIGSTQSFSNPFNGWLEEFRFTHEAIYTADFIPQGLPYSSSAYTDSFSINRGQMNTAPTGHEAQDRFQKVLRYVAQSPADIINDLITNYTDTPAGYVPLSEWQTECNNYLGLVYSFNIAEPTAVASLVSEIIVQAALALWDDNLNQKIRLQVLRSVPLDVEIYDMSKIKKDTFKNDDQPDKRASQVLVYYGQIDPTKKVDDDDNYRSSKHVTDTEAENNYGASIRKVHARGIAAAGAAIASRLADLVLARYKIAPRKFELGLMRESASAPMLGGGRNIQYWNLQDATGAEETVPTQIIRLKPSPADFAVDLEEMRFDAPDVDLNNRQISISVNTNNVNLRTVHDGLYPPVTSGQSVTCTIQDDVIVGSTSTGLFALESGTWPAGVTVNLIVLGRIQGKGGDGANAQSNPGQVGGGALRATQAINLTDTNGQIWGGGGGGGSGSFFQPGGDPAYSGAGGGGGAGQIPGTGGNGGSSPQGMSPAGQPGTTEAGGPGGSQTNFPAGGAGGGPGLPGAAGQTVSAAGGAGGAAGKAITGIAFVTTVGAAGDRRGGTV